MEVGADVGALPDVPVPVAEWRLGAVGWAIARSRLAAAAVDPLNASWPQCAGPALGCVGVALVVGVLGAVVVVVAPGVGRAEEEERRVTVAPVVSPVRDGLGSALTIGCGVSVAAVEGVVATVGVVVVLVGVFVVLVGVVVTGVDVVVVGVVGTGVALVEVVGVVAVTGAAVVVAAVGCGGRRRSGGRHRGGGRGRRRGRG